MLMLILMRTVPRTALVLAPLFVHLEILFKLGYNPTLQKSIHLSITEELKKLTAKSTKKEL